MATTPFLRQQRTIRRPVAVSGFGYWSGQTNRVEFYPAPAGTGVVFVRVDLSPALRVAVRLEHCVEAEHRTNLSAGVAQVEMVEHVLAALSASEIDNCEVRVTSAEMPGFDGSSVIVADAIVSAGVECLGAPLQPIVVRQAVRVGDSSAWIEAVPHGRPGLCVEYTLDYEGRGPIGTQHRCVYITPETFRMELAAARTFVTQQEAESLRSRGLGTRVTPKDLLILGPNGPLENAFRWPDECVRHKLLDMVGDLSLAGRPLHAHVRGYRSGHRLNAMLVKQLLAADSAASFRRTA